MAIGLASLAWRVAGCAVATALAWRGLGATGLVYAAPLLAVAFARPLIELAAALHRTFRHAAWRDVEGRHYAYRGRPMRVVTDADGYRWLRLADLRAVVGFTASDGALALAYPDDWRRVGGEPYLGEEALLAHLAKERSPEALRLRRWASRDVVLPARRARERLGVRHRPGR